MRNKLDQRQKRKEEQPLRIDKKNPVFPAYQSRGRSGYLLLAFRRDHLPSKCGGETLWREIETEDCVGILTDRILPEYPARIGISIGMSDCSDAAFMLRSAFASLQGGFRFCSAQERGKSEVSAADIQLYLFEHLSEDISLEQLAQNFLLRRPTAATYLRNSPGIRFSVF